MPCSTLPARQQLDAGNPGTSPRQMGSNRPGKRRTSRARLKRADPEELVTIKDYDRAAVPLLTYEQLAGWLNDSIRHLRRLVDEQRIPYHKVGHFVRFDQGEIKDWLTAHHHGHLHQETPPPANGDGADRRSMLG